DGLFEYSPEVEIRLDEPLPQFALEGFPSPCDALLTVRLSLAEAGTMSIRLHDIAGRVVMILAQDAVLPAGSHSMLVRTAEVPSGPYLLVVDTREGRRTQKVVIRH
ncbi:MAG: T9SS type A sorting domain-containing protein, partial [Bacteroidetes bacterium]|nr:T9SS type A sorting domain-containing protein [Bacteroidota bacterium]